MLEKESEARYRSYSQFGEDTCLAAYFQDRLMAKNGSTPPGFFVDVGCFQPFSLSNTFLFYEKGWRGINIDATPGVKERFDIARPADCNLWCAVSSATEDLLFYTWGNSVYNTTSKAIAEELLRQGRVPREPEIIKPPTRTLRSILDEYRPNGSIEFLNIDAEGHDIEVLKSNDWLRYRPEIILIEEHGWDITRHLQGSTYKFLAERGYSLYAWTPPTLFFRRL